MKSDAEMVPRTGTSKLGKKTRQVRPSLSADVDYRPVPHADVSDDSRPVWRLRFDVLSTDQAVSFGWDVNGEITFGRGKNTSDFVDLSPYNAEMLGVSRRHLVLRPSATNLYVLDVESTNGTWRNGLRIGVNVPYALHDGDIITLGRLQLAVRIIQRPKQPIRSLRSRADLADTLVRIAKAITSQLNLDEILNQALGLAMSLTEADETAVWLMDEHSGELFLEAESGIEDEYISRMRLTVADTLAGQVIKSGQPLRTSRGQQGELVKIKTGYLVEAVVYVPLTLGEVTFGVLAAAHREPGKSFSEQSEELLSSIADFVAIAVQNARVYQAADKAKSRYFSELATLNKVTQAISASGDLEQIYAMLVDQIRQHRQMEHATLWLMDERAETLSPFPAIQEQNGGAGSKVLRVGEGIVGRVAETGEPQVVDDLYGQTDLKMDDEDTLKLDGQSIACLPLRNKGQVVGVLVLSSQEESAFTAKDVDRLQAFANLVSIAIENASLLAQSERERAIISTTANALSQPLMVVGSHAQLVLSNQAADALLDKMLRLWSVDGAPAEGTSHTGPLTQLLGVLGADVGRTSEIAIGEETYLATVDIAPGLGTVIVMQDITNERRLERARTEFVAALSHDLKGPLQSIRGYAELLQDERTTLEQSMKSGNEIQKSSDRVLTMVKQLLDVALLSDTTQAQVSPCDLADTATTAINDLRGAALQKSIDLNLMVRGSPYDVEADETRLYRSVLNLIENAIKFSDEGGKVIVKLSFGDDEVSLAILDDGPGIPEEDLPHIFEKYFRARSTPGRAEGMGLGLALVQATVRAHGGEVSARNVKGHGAEFVVKLPATLRAQ